nr:sigma-70 family RNA polymerase sigma factor [Nitrosomonas nitrosa]
METEPETYKTYSAEDLLVVISMADDDPKEAQLAFEELVMRFREELVRYCTTMCNTEASPSKLQVVFDPGDAVEIVWNAFYQIKKSADTFDIKKANTPDVERAVEAYLKGFVRTEFKKKYFWIPKAKVEYNYVIDTSPDGVLMPTRKVLSEMTTEIEQALSILSWKEREVFLAYAEFCPNDEYIPREISQLLQDKLDLAPSTLRVYRDRARKKIQDRLNNPDGK